MISENIKKNELEGMILPVVSIDEFEPKSGTENEVIVIAFYCKEFNVSKDLRDFLEKTIIRTLDIDLSNNCDENGNYLVFVELQRKKNSIQEILDLTKEVNRLSPYKEWKVSMFRVNTVIPLTVEAISRHLKLSSYDEQCVSFFATALSFPKIKNDVLEFNNKDKYYVLDFDEKNSILDKNKILISLHPSQNERDLEMYLGRKFLIVTLDDGRLLIQNGDNATVVEKI